MKTGIKILLALWMSAMCLSCYAAFSAWGDGHTSSVTGVDSYVVANKKKNTRKKKKRKEKNKKNSDVETVVPALTSEEQRRYDYFFLEAVRLKLQRKYDAAFEVLQHCLAINPEAASAQYELAQYYMFLKQIPKGQQALEKAVKTNPTISGMHRDWPIFISSKMSRTRRWICWKTWLPALPTSLIRCTT